VEEGTTDADSSPQDRLCNGTAEPSSGEGDANEPGINLLEALMATQKEAAEYREGWQRERADYSNFRKRSERQRQEIHQQTTLSFFRQLLPLIDDLERAIENIPPDFEGAAWRDGLTLIQRKAGKLLEENEIETVNPVGCEFDPKVHEAIGIEETHDVDSNTITETLQKGYLYKGRILRPALVRVAK
jgi:molecular chaperone GrpE